MDDKTILNILSNKINFHRAAMIQATNSEQAFAHEDSLRFYEATALRLRELADDNARLRHLLDDTHAAYTKTLERAEEFADALKGACDYIEPFPCKRPPGATADCEHVNCVASRKFRNALEKP